MRKSWLASTVLVMALAAAGCGGGGAQTQGENNNAGTGNGGEKVKLTIESWRTDDMKVWNEVILPAFEAKYPNIQVEFKPTQNTEYGTSLSTKLSAGTAGDLIMVEPYDFRIDMAKNGSFAKLNDLEGLNKDNFPEMALDAWKLDDGTQFAVPLASVLHGYIYNKAIFDELKLQVPTTREQFFQVLDAVKKDGKYTPFAMGTADQFVPGLLGFNLNVPGFNKGEEGRLALIEGKQKFTDAPYVQTWEFLRKLADYMPDGYESITYADMQNLFMSGQAAVYPAGSWEISIFKDKIGSQFEYGAFPLPVEKEGDTGYINNHPDSGMALNAATKHPEEAKQFLQWLMTPEFAELWNNALPGFFSLSSHKVELKDPLAQQFMSWVKDGNSSPRLAYQLLSRGEPNTDAELGRISALVMNKKMEPAEAAKTIQDGLDGWFKPKAK